MRLQNHTPLWTEFPKRNKSKEKKKALKTKKYKPKPKTKTNIRKSQSPEALMEKVLTFMELPLKCPVITVVR